MNAMHALLPYLVGLAMFATVAFLVVGVVGFALNGEFYRKNANKLMRGRVLGQAATLALLGLLMWFVARW